MNLYHGSCPPILCYPWMSKYHGSRRRGGCSQGFEIAPRILKRKIEKRTLLLRSTVLVQILARKKSQISVQVACRDHIILISQTDDIVFLRYINNLMLFAIVRALQKALNLT